MREHLILSEYPETLLVPSGCKIMTKMSTKDCLQTPTLMLPSPFVTATQQTVRGQFDELTFPLAFTISKMLSLLV